MFTSADAVLRARARQTARRDLLLAVLCAVFSAIYEHFSHGVVSWFMVLLFLFPLLGGALPYWILSRTAVRFPKQTARDFYRSGVTTLAFGSCIAGILEIYGTTSPYLFAYWIAGGLLIAAGLGIYTGNS